jgi:hypothetical protein
MRLSRRVLTALVVGALGIAMAVPASARSPKETESFSDKGFTSRMPNPGYRQPPLFYYRGQTFNVTFTLHNDSVENNNNVAKTACFTLQVFRLPDFDPAIDRHETWLEANRDEHQVLVFDGARETLNFAADETKTLTRGATLTADGYYQFDYGFCSDVPLLPKEGYEAPGAHARALWQRGSGSRRRCDCSRQRANTGRHWIRSATARQRSMAGPPAVDGAPRSGGSGPGATPSPITIKSRHESRGRCPGFFLGPGALAIVGGLG